MDARVKGRLELELLEARPIDAGAPAADAARVPFSLLFRGPGEPVLAQRIHPLRTTRWERSRSTALGHPSNFDWKRS